MADAFEKFKSSINRGVTAINVKTNASLEKAKIKTQIETIQNEVQGMMGAVGEAVFLMGQRGDAEYSKLNNHLEVIRKKKAEIAALQAELVAIDERSNQIMGSSSTNNAVPVTQTGNICPKCRSPYADGAKFCRKCGQKLQVESAPVQEGV